MIEVLLPLLLLAALAYALRRLPQTLNAKRHSHRLSQPGEAGWTYEFANKTFSLYTTAFNGVPKIVVSKWSPAARKLYDMGSVSGALGVVAAMGGALWALSEVWRAVWAEARLHAMQKPAAGEVMAVAITKRAMAPMAEGVSQGVSLSGGLQPLIPGVTTPLSHLPTLVLAVLVNQIIHEVGHALAAALDDIPPTKLSFDLYMLIPSMTVSFPKAVDLLPAASKLRLASSGPWHNLVTYILIASVAWGGLGNFYWRDASGDGRIIERVDVSSPLYAHVKEGMMVTHLDDVFLGGDEDTWKTYLESDEIGDAGRGWCIERKLYEDLTPPPCTRSNEIEFLRTIISPTSGTQARCLAPHPMLNVPSGKCPCPSAKWICVRPSPEEQILRIQLGSRSRNSENVVLWSGDRREVLEDVKVGRETPRVAGGLVRWGTLFVEYLSSIALSLFLFNLLPLPKTDGSHMLRSLLSLVRSRQHSDPAPSGKPLQAKLSSPARGGHARINMPTININPNIYREYELSDDEEMMDEEEGRRGRREERWKVRLRKSIEGGMIAVLLGWVAGWCMLALLRSS